MHGNHQNWKGNKGVPEGAPLSLHRGCLATPASSSLSAPSLSAPRNPSRLTTAAQPVALSGIHFTFFSSFPSPSFAYPYSGIPMLSFSPVAQFPDHASLVPPPLLLLLISTACFLCHSLFHLTMYLRRYLQVLIPSRKLRFLAPLPHLQFARVYPLHRRVSLTFRTFSVLPCI